MGDLEEEVLNGMLSMSLTEAHGDIKTYEKNVHDTLAGFPDMREKRLKDYERIFTLVSPDDTARTRRRKVLEFFTANMKENLNRSGHIQECSHQCLVLIDELRELTDRLVCWLTLCLPANDHPLSVSHRRKLKQFKNRLKNETKKLEGLRAGVTHAHSARVNTIRSMFTTKDVSDNNLVGWEKAHHELLIMQETEAYLLMCHVWIVTMDSAYLVYNYWKVNLKDADLAFESGQNASGNHDFFS
eukprot:g10609.t1